MSLKPYKFIVQAVVQQIDDDGNVRAELATEPAVILGCDALKAWADDFPDKLAAAEDPLKARDETDSAVAEPRS